MDNQSEINRIKANIAAAYTALAAKGATMPTTRNSANLEETVGSVSNGLNLNFAVVGGISQPSSPAENTIWINTSIAIIDYQFAPETPTTRSDGTALQEGDVWIVTFKESSVEFNAVTGAVLKIYPTQAKQYLSSVWVDKEMQIHQNGVWVVPSAYLYHTGNLRTEITGGWGTVKYVPNDDYYSNYISFSDFSGYLRLKVSTTTHNSVGYMYAKNKIDLTQYTKLCIDLEITGSSKTCFYAYIASELPTSTTTPTSVKSKSSGVMDRGILEIDISDVAQACYIVFRIYKSSAWGSTSHTIDIHKVWLE